MGRKPKAGGVKVEETDPEQSARFLEAAREAGVDETGEAFERAFEKIAAPKGPALDDGPRNRPAKKPASRR